MPIRTKVNLTIDSETLAQAKEMEINMSRVADEAIAKAAKAERERRWKEEHAEAFEAYNRYIEENGVPFAHLRKF